MAAATSERPLHVAIGEPSEQEAQDERDQPVVCTERPQDREVPEVEAVAERSQPDQRT